MINDVMLLWLAAFPLMGSPGPATISLAGIGTAFGFRQGMAYLSGIILGTVGVLVMIATGVTALLLAMPTFVTVLTVAAAVYIVYLAWKIASAPVGVTDITTKQVPSFPAGLILALANPKAFAAIGAVYSSHTIIEDNLIGDSAVKIITLTLVIIIVNTVWLAFGSSFSHILTDARLGRIANIIFAVLLIVSVAFALI